LDNITSFTESLLTNWVNETSYADVAGEHGQKFRINAWKGFVVADFLRKIYRETRPYEINKGETDILYEKSLAKLIKCVENGSKGLHKVISGMCQCRL